MIGTRPAYYSSRSNGPNVRAMPMALSKKHNAFKRMASLAAISALRERGAQQFFAAVTDARHG